MIYLLMYIKYITSKKLITLIICCLILTISQFFCYTFLGDRMRGIDLNKPIVYKHSSLRFFEKNEHHISRVCDDDVLLLVYEGTLRFLENGEEYAVTAGHYHIQQHGSRQAGHLPSDSPKYLYVHFRGIGIHIPTSSIIPVSLTTFE